MNVASLTDPFGRVSLKGRVIIITGAIETPMFLAALQGHPTLRQIVEDGHPIGRIGQAAEVAEAVAWLLSDAASFITACIAVDGGYTSR